MPIQIQHLLKLNRKGIPRIRGVNNSNTTLVKVKYFCGFLVCSQDKYSNTTLVKVK